jgi:hypothetical protein
MRQQRSIPVAQKCSPKTEVIFPSYLVQKFVWTCLIAGLLAIQRNLNPRVAPSSKKSCQHAIDSHLISLRGLQGKISGPYLYKKENCLILIPVIWGSDTQSANWQPLLVSVASFGMQMLLLSKTNLDASSHMCSKLPKLIISFICIKWKSHCI